MRDHDTDADWEQFARKEPYWSVLSADEFRRNNITSAKLERFFRSGVEHIGGVADTLERRFGANRNYGISLDFGCGVGRLLFGLAGLSRKAIGVDVSPTMLSLCREHAKERGIANLELHQIGDDLAPLAPYEGSIDLITSFIVFQHIPPRRGIPILGRLLRLLRRGAVGYLHITFASTIATIQHEASNATGSLYNFFQRTSDGVLKLVEHPAGDIQIQMNHYNMNEVMCCFYQNGISDIFTRFTNHSNTIGAELYFRKS